MASSRVAIRYVKSLLSLASDQNQLDQVHTDLRLLTRVLIENRDLLLMLRNPVIKPHKKSEILSAIFKKRISTLTLAFLDIICRKGRESILPQIAETFHLVYNSTMGIGAATVVTAFPIDKELRREIEVIACKLNQKDEVELKEEVDEDLIGGFILSVEDRQLDTSLRSSLNRLKLQFSHDPYKKYT